MADKAEALRAFRERKFSGATEKDRGIVITEKPVTIEQLKQVASGTQAEPKKRGPYKKKGKPAPIEAPKKRGPRGPYKKRQK